MYLATCRKPHLEGDELEQSLEEVDQVLSHQAQSDSLAQRQEVSRKLLEWMEIHQSINVVRKSVEAPLLNEIKGAHFRCLRASVKRQGDWGNLSFPQLLGGGARSRAIATLTPLIHRFSQRCEELAADPELQAASELPKQAQRTFMHQCEEIHRNCDIWGRQQAIKAIKADPQLWERCAAERGRGQVSRLHSHFTEWFSSPSWQDQKIQLDKLITSSWSELLKNLRSILEE